MQIWTRLTVLVSALVLVTWPARQAHAVPPPAPWTVQNIGPFITSGFVDVDPRGFWTIRGANGDVSQSADSFFYVSQPLTGDGSILALLFGQQGGNPQFGKAGLMIRADTTSGAANIHFFMTSGRGLGITYRPFAKQPTVNEGAGRQYGARQFPMWLRLQREGDRFTPFISADGFAWDQVHSPITLPGFPREATIGLTAASLFEGSVSAAFGNVTVVPGRVSPNVQVSAGNGRALLTWQPVQDARGYTVRRSAANVPGFAADLITPEPIKETSLTDANLPNGQAVRYLVSTTFEENGQQIEGWTTAVTAFPVPTPGNLFGCDISIEATQLRGGILFDPATGTYSIAGAGAGIGGTEDHAFLASQLVKGDFQITAKILEKSNAMAGVMARENMDGNSRMAFFGGGGRQGVAFQYREQAGETTGLTGPPALSDADFRPPVFLRLVRRGNSISPFLSADGTTFTPAGPPKTFSPPLPDSLYVGYAISSMNPAATATSAFSDLSIGAPPAP
jgi:hypothetical protein